MCYGRSPSDQTPLAPRPKLGTKEGNKRVHTVWVAWLMYNNNETVQERSFHDYLFLPMNWLATVMGNTNFIHCQIVFWDAVNRRYYTYSSDTTRGVHVWHRKQFADNSWRFVKLLLTEPQELLLQNFLAAQLHKPMNSTGQFLLYFGGSSGQNQSWFCSELITAGLQHAGVVNFAEWPGFTMAHQVAPQHLFDYLTRFCTTCPTELLPGNPVQITNVYEQRRATGAIQVQLGVGVLPQAVADFSTQAAAQPYYLRHQEEPPEQEEPQPRTANDLLSSLVVKQPKK